MHRFTPLFVLTLCVFSRSAAALPSARSSMIGKRNIAPSLWSELNIFEQYSAAAYCKSNTESGNVTSQKVTCTDAGANNCPLVQNASTSIIAEFAKPVTLFWISAGTDVTGFVAYDDTRKLTVVSFRGSHSIENFATDLDFEKTDTDLCAGCEAHRGFLDSWNDAKDTVLGAVKSAAEAHADYRLVVTGHSLGAALATLCAAELRTDGYTAALYTYGSPRVGNAALAEFVSKQAGGNYRVTHTDDPIPHLPLIAMGFQHISPEYYISSDNGIVVEAASITQLVGSNNLTGSGGQLVTDIASHLWYFNSIVACGLEL